MLTKVHKWGNSLGVRIPKSFATEARFHEGVEIDLSLVNGNVVLRPVARPSYRLDDLLAGSTEQNIHAEIDTGSPVGREIW
jgi:antitoxin MazE